MTERESGKNMNATDTFLSVDDKLQKKLCDLRVLIVDDHPDIRSIEREVLSGLGVTRIFEAGNGRAALSLLDESAGLINFIICDWNMPDLNGLALLRHVRSSHAALPFIMVTGKSDAGSVMMAKEAGVSAYMRKPFSPKQLEDKVKTLAQAGE